MIKNVWPFHIRLIIINIIQFYVYYIASHYLLLIQKPVGRNKNMNKQLFLSVTTVRPVIHDKFYGQFTSRISPRRITNDRQQLSCKWRYLSWRPDQSPATTNEWPPSTTLPIQCRSSRLSPFLCGVFTDRLPHGNFPRLTVNFPSFLRFIHTFHGRLCHRSTSLRPSIKRRADGTICLHFKIVATKFVQ